MDKVLVIIPDNNKGKFIAKGFSSAFKEFSYFVIEKKIYDLNLEEIQKIKPDIIFTFWSDVMQGNELEHFFENYENDETIYIHISELIADIPDSLKKKENNYCFSYDNKKKKYRIIPSILPKDYKNKFNGYRYALTFAGNPAIEQREEILSKLVYNFGVINIFCRSYDFYKSVDDIFRKGLLNEKYIDLYRESYRGYVEDQKSLSQIYSASKVNLDMPDETNKPVNYRCLEILASGGFVISPYNDVIITNFEDGKEIETYKNDSELIDKIRFYMTNTNIARLISSKGKKNTASNHSFYDRLKSILKVIYGKNSCSR